MHHGWIKDCYFVHQMLLRVFSVKKEVSKLVSLNHGHHTSNMVSSSQKQFQRCCWQLACNIAHNQQLRCRSATSTPTRATANGASPTTELSSGNMLSNIRVSCCTIHGRLLVVRRTTILSATCS